MVAVSQVLLSSVNFKENTVLNLKQLWRSQDFTDITLASSDGFKLEAHKSVLSSSSSLFKDLLVGSQHPNVLIYMRGVTLRELELLLEFTYTGECQVEEAELESFLRTGQELGVKGLLENFLVDSKAMESLELADGRIEELAKEGNITSDLKPCFDEGPPVNIEFLVDKKPELLSVLNSKNTRAGQDRSKSGFNGGPAVNIEAPLDKKPVLNDPLEVTFGGNSPKPDEKEDGEFECGTCSKSFSSKKRLKIHTHKNHGKVVICQKCGHKAFSKVSLHSHERNVHGGLRFMCDQCPFQANIQSKITWHTKSKHGGKRYQCDQCEHPPYTECRKLVKHINLKHGGFLCEYCDPQAGTGNKQSTCTQCNYSCSLVGHLRKHMRKHSDKKPFGCTQCNFYCEQASNLKQHMFTHSGEKPFKCEQCNYSCGQAKDLKKHKLTHTGEKPFTCEQCSYSSTQSNNMKYHMLSHTGEKPFACKQCNYSCKMSYELKRHIRKHTTETDA